jgi:hypothetical protein
MQSQSLHLLNLAVRRLRGSKAPHSTLLTSAHSTAEWRTGPAVTASAGPPWRSLAVVSAELREREPGFSGRGVRISGGALGQSLRGHHHIPCPRRLH